MAKTKSSVEARREKILQAAEALIRDRGEVEFSMRALAEAAGVSFATPFNHFGNKEGILQALLSARIDRELAHLQDRSDEQTPLETLFHLVDHSASAYLEDADLYRPILRSVWSAGLNVTADHAANVLELWEFALRRMYRADMFVEGPDLEMLARRLHFSFVVALLQWAGGGLKDEELADHARDLIVGCLLRWLSPPATSQVLEACQNQSEP